MKLQMAEATEEKLEDDERVVDASVEMSDKGAYVEARVENQMKARDLRADLSQYPIWVDIVVT